MSKLSLTGDPFVDMGGLVMETLPEKTIEDKIHFATEVYVDGWKGKVDSIFLLSKLNNNQVKNKPDRQREGTLEYYLGALKGDGAISEGPCRICAVKGHLFKGGRNNYPLVGSGGFTNFITFRNQGCLFVKIALLNFFFFLWEFCKVQAILYCFRF